MRQKLLKGIFAVLADLVRLIILILFLPLIIIFIGPFLVISVLRGRQGMGPITLDSTRYDFAGRAGIFMLGLAIWILVWSGLAWLGLNAVLPAPVAVQPPLPGADIPTAGLMLTFTPAPSATPVTRTPTLTPVPPTSTLTPTPTPTLGPIIPVPAPPGAPAVVFTSTPLFNEKPAANTPTPNAVLTVTPLFPIPTITVTLVLTGRQAAIDTLEEANKLLRNAIALANKENIENLGAVWRDRALTNIADFASELYGRYAKPFSVDFEYISPPTIRDRLSNGDIVVISRERWRYGGPTAVDEEAFEFVYTFSQREGRWVITKYSYKNLPLSTPTTIPLNGTPAPHN